MQKVGQGNKVSPKGLVILFLEVVRQFRHLKDCLNLEQIHKRVIWNKIRTQTKRTEFP